MRRIVFLVASVLVFLSFLPSRAMAEVAYDLVPDQVYAERDQEPLKADLYVPQGKGPFPAMIIIHGGAWATGTKDQLSGVAKALARLGYTSMAISYRLAPQHPFPAQIYDCQAAVRWLRANAAKYKVDPERVGGYGYSAGGELVALLGALDDDDDVREPGLAPDAPSARLQVVVAGGAPCDFGKLPADNDRIAYWLGGTRAQKPDAYREASPINYVTADDPPMFFFHGGSDQIVQPTSPQAMVARLKAVGVPAEFCEIPGADHMSAASDRPTVLQALAFVDRYLGQNKSTARATNKPPTSRGAPVHGE
jgi:acetyl esterase/lipase